MNWPQDFIEQVGIEPYYHDEHGVIYCGDCLKIMPEMPQKCIDLVVTDPAYDTLEKYRAIGTTTRLKRHWFQTISQQELNEVLKLFAQLLKTNTHAYLFANYDCLPYYYYMQEIPSDFKLWKPLIWHKLGPLGMGYHYRNQYELVMFYEKGKRKLKDLSIPDILSAYSANHQGFIKNRIDFPTAKPIDIIEVFIKQSSKKKDIVLDSFLGSGTTPIGAIRLNRRYIGIEIDPNTCKRAVEYIERELRRWE